MSILLLLNNIKHNIKWLLRDEFNDTLSAGSVNGTKATDGINDRTVVDTGSKLNIANGKLNISGSSGGDNPSIWYSAVARFAGKMLFQKINASSIGGVGARIGFDNNQATSINPFCYILYTTGITINNTSAYVKVGGLWTLNTDYVFCIILRPTGCFYYIKGGDYTNWTLLYVLDLNAQTSLYPAIGCSDNSNVFALNFIRMPQDLWLPTPRYSDNFAGTNGDLVNGRIPNGLGQLEQSGLGSGQLGGGAWISPSGSISGNALIHTPVLGSELLTNGDFSAWTGDNPNWWSLSNVEDAGNYISENSGACRVVSNGGQMGIQSPSNIITAHSWYKYSMNITNATLGALRFGHGAWTGVILKTCSTTGNHPVTFKHSSNTTASILRNSGGANVTFDDVSLKKLTLSELFSSLAHSTTCVLHSAKFTRPVNEYQFGLVSNLSSNFADGDTNTHNFVLTYFDGTTIKTEKCVNGTYSNIGSTAATGGLAYSAGAKLEVRIDPTYTNGVITGLKHNVYYNNAYVHTATEVTRATDPTIIDNTRHGIFSTDASNTIDDYTSYAVGANGEYNSVLDKYSKD